MTRPPMPPLTPEETRIIRQKGTERAFTGAYWDHFAPGVYICRQCGVSLYSSESKFRSGCGWPSFDDEVPWAVERRPDPDGVRTEIVCAACGGHLGHVFEGEGLTARDVRHCVNSASVAFQPAMGQATAEACFAGGCFWGVEHQIQEADGVIDVASGYTGGRTPDPTYEEVCSGRTGHAEAVRVRYDPARVSFETLARLFFEIHDPTQIDRQGPDVGNQYRSVIFYQDAEQRSVAERLVAILRGKGYDVATRIERASVFYPAEDYHQNYIERHPERRCHARVRRFDTPDRP